MVTKPPIPSRVRRPVAPGRRDAPGADLARPFVEAPTPAMWKADTAEGRVGGRANDPVLRSIDELVSSLASATDGVRLYVLGQLFFNTMFWLNHQPKHPLMDTCNRKPVMALNMFAGNTLAACLGCGHGQLAGRLQNLYGVRMTPYGVEVDAKEDPRYFNATQREVFRTFVVYGKLTHYRSGGQGRFDILDSQNCYTDGRPGYGFVLSMSNELFIGHFGQMRKTYHSTFLAGRPVQCAGTIQLKNGTVTHISNNSGHYKPIDQSLLKVLLYLKMNGLDVRDVIVESAVHKIGDVAKTSTGAEFMRAHGNWEAIRAPAYH